MAMGWRTRLPTAFNTAIGIVRVHLQAPSAPWEAGTVSPAQQLVTQPPPGFSSQPFVDNDRRLTLWNPEKKPPAAVCESTSASTGYS